MTHSLNNYNKPSPKDKKFQSEKETVPPESSQLWRNRLNKNKLHSGKTKLSSTLANTSSGNANNRFQNTSPSNTSRKAKKGHRPG